MAGAGAVVAPVPPASIRCITKVLLLSEPWPLAAVAQRAARSAGAVGQPMTVLPIVVKSPYSDSSYRLPKGSTTSAAAGPAVNASEPAARPTAVTAASTLPR